MVASMNRVVEWYPVDEQQRVIRPPALEMYSAARLGARWRSGGSPDGANDVGKIEIRRRAQQLPIQAPRSIRARCYRIGWNPWCRVDRQDFDGAHRRRRPIE